LKADLKDTIVGVVLAITLPVLTVLIYEFTNTHSWTLPVIFVLLAIIFSNKKIIALTGVSVLFALTWSWVQAPVLPVIIAGTDHAIRMVILVVMFCFVLYINHVFRRAIAESQEKANKEKLLSDIAAVLMIANEGNVDVMIKEVMALWGKQLQADRLNIYFLDDGQKAVNSAYQWCSSNNIKADVGLGSAEKGEIFAAATAFSRRWGEGNPGIAEADVLAGSETEKQWAAKIRAGALMIIPLKNAAQLIGIVAVEKAAGGPEWKEEQQKTCHVVARMVTDVWLRIEADRKIRYDAYYDSLTGLPNRQHFLDRLRQAVNMAMRTDKLVGVLFIDIDSFKYINDTMGHAGGDLLLHQIGYATL
jgi:predicted signal transduction protein with EAL and GGDEF domain